MEEQQPSGAPSAPSPPAEQNTNKFRRIKTYIQGLDESMQGGIPEGHVTLVSGSAGTMKSSICFNVLYNEAIYGHSGLYISLEQSGKSLMKHVESMGYDMSKINLILVEDLATLQAKVKQQTNANAGKLVLVDIGAIRKEIKDLRVADNKSWLNVVKNIVKKVQEAIGIELFVLDSMSALYVLSRFENPRIELFYIFEFLRDLKLTTYLISEMEKGGDHYSEFGIEDFLSDGIIHLKLTSFRRSVVREIHVVKMRATSTNNDIFSLEYKDGHFQALYGGQNPLL